MSNQEKIRKVLGLLELQDRSMAWLGKSLGASRQSVQKWLSGESVPRDGEVYDHMLAALDGSSVRDMFVSDSLVREGYNVLDRPKIPVGVPTVQMRYAGEVPCSADWGDPLSSEEFIEVEVQFEHPQRFAAKVVGDSCYPALLPSDVTIWHTDLSPTYGLVVLAQRKGDHGCTVKELEYDQNLGRPRLVPVNPAHHAPSDGDGWGVIARLVAVLRTIDGLRRSWYIESGLRPRHLID